jgi:uncharacterized protein YecE (DUF72 family)
MLIHGEAESRQWAAKGRSMKKSIRIGTSGFIYKHWRGAYYPEKMAQKDWFGHYSRDFDTVELNNTFYRLPTDSTFEHWRRVAPEGFLFTFKASRYITHIKRLNDPRQTLAKFLAGVRLTADHLGPLLFQLPPRWQADAGRLESFLQALPEDLTKVLEFRDPSWYSEEVKGLLRRYRAVFCIHDHGAAPAPEWVTGAAVYLRFHGPGEPAYMGSYQSGFLESVAGKMRNWAAAGLAVFAYFNNDWQGHAVRNAMELKKFVS